MVLLPPETLPLRDGLLAVGFRQDRLRENVVVPEFTKSASLLAFADQPLDSRTACIAVVPGSEFGDPDLAKLRGLGAPLVFQCFPDHCIFWSQTRNAPQFQSRLAIRDIPRFFRENEAQFSPLAIYRAKLWGRLEQSYQLRFVDTGLMPLIEEESGERLTHLVERVVRATKRELGWLADVSEADGRWLLQSTFWLLAAKILQDKDVPGFVRLSLTDVETVYDRLARHYDSQNPRPVRVGSKAKREALVAAAEQIEKFGHCGCVSTEALAYLYESALIDRETRSKLGTHSTPPWLVDYIVGRLRPWIEDMEVGERRVFEPACGHAAFLISAMRTLSELLPPDWQEPRQKYLRQRLHGIEIDPFALEVARLSLTLADVPNPNGWALKPADMFRGNQLESEIAQAKIVLGNPPFEKFDSEERESDWLPNKAAETFRRVVDHLADGAIFGFVLPQTFLHSKQAKGVRETLLRDFEINEISLFADKVFRYGEPESVVLIGRRLAKQGVRNAPIRYQRIREKQVKEFSQTYTPSTRSDITPSQLVKSSQASFLVPELAEVWEAVSGLPRLSDFVDSGKGFDHKGDDELPPGTIKVSPTKLPGLTPGFANWTKYPQTHCLPILSWLNLDPNVLGAKRRGTDIGLPQVLLNYGRAGRDRWRLKALIDRQGHPVTSRFVVVRPAIERLSLGVLWAFLNSPICNAYASCVSSKRDVLTGDISRIPVPDFRNLDCSGLENSVREYFEAAQSLSYATTKPHKSSPRSNRKQRTFNYNEEVAQGEDASIQRENLKCLHWRIDAAVLRLYDLPAKLERQVLGLFSNVRRRGVPFEQTEYFPQGFTEVNRLSELLAITLDWPKTNERRAELIDREEEGRLTTEQATELKELQRLADARVSLLKPVQMEAIDKKIAALERRGLWTKSS